MSAERRQDWTWRLRSFLNRFGVDVVPYLSTRHPLARRKQFFTVHGIDCVLDVGANAGQYGQFLRRIGFTGQIRSFEPLTRPFRQLQLVSAGDPKWLIFQAAIGDKAGHLTINVSANSECSSALPILDRHLAAYPAAAYVGREEVKVQTVDDIISEVPKTASVFLKVDAQGYEHKILQGAISSFGRIRGIQLEMSLVPLYEDETLLPEMVNWLKERGFVLMGLEPGSSDEKTGQLLQVDGLFFRQVDHRI